MTNHPGRQPTDSPRATRVRRAARLLALAPAVAVTGLTGTAFADAPDSWENNPPTAPLHVILILLIIPVALFALIVLAVYLPSMSKGESYQPGQPWRSEPQWFGGPREGVAAADRVEQPALTSSEESGRGGASGRW